ncbi:hypothetical protein [Bradyrhizobium sp. 143]|uniref:hypothetical protein n=1 Tax=Bradyrhizobium sp. 143 TaxID=2782619 RepID=UPI001FF92159|nr:hypothetical protein [Bradyrhizobium sp. 143]
MVQDAPLSGVTLTVPILVRLAREVPLVSYFKMPDSIRPSDGKVPIRTINDCPQPNYAKRRSGESDLAMGLASITSPQSESRFAASESLPIPSGRKML